MELAPVFMASRGGWSVAKIGRPSGVSYKFEFEASFLEWRFNYDGCKYSKVNSNPNFYLHPGLQRILQMQRKRYPSNRSRTIRLDDHPTLEEYLEHELGAVANSHAVQEIELSNAITNFDNAIHYPITHIYKDPFHNQPRTWPNCNHAGIPYIYDATHYVKGVTLSRSDSENEVIYDDIRYRQHGCIEGRFYPDRIDEHWDEGVGGQQGKIEHFIEKIEETIIERGENSRVLVFENDLELKFDAWSSDPDFQEKWKDLIEYLRFVVVDFEHHIPDMEGADISGLIPIVSFGPPEASFCCYMFTPAKEKVS